MEVTEDDTSATQKSYEPLCFMDNEACAQLASFQAVNCTTLFEGPLFNASSSSGGANNAKHGPDSSESASTSEAAAVVVSAISFVCPLTLHNAHSREVSSVFFSNCQQSRQITASASPGLGESNSLDSLSSSELPQSEVPPLADPPFSFSLASDSCLTYKSTYTNNSVVPLHESFLKRKRSLQTEVTWVRGSKRLKSDIRTIVGT